MATAPLNKMTLRQLRTMCEEQGLDSQGLKKPQLVELLEQYADGGESDEGQEAEEEHVGVDSSDDDDDLEIDVSKYNPQQLEFKLISARLKEMRERVKTERQLKALREGGGGPSVDVAAVHGNMRDLLPTMDDNNVLDFFNSYERVMMLNDVPDSLWHKWLSGKLSVKANQVYSKIPIEQCRDYAAVKVAILDAYKLNARRYYQNYMTARRMKDENNKMFLGRLNRLQSYYLDSKSIESFEQLKDDDLSHRLLDTLNPEARSFVEQRQPTSSAEIAKLADLYFEVQSQMNYDAKNHGKFIKTDSSNASRSDSNNVPGGQTKGAWANRGRNGGRFNAGAGRGKFTGCFECGSTEHKRSFHDRPGENTTVFKGQGQKCSVCSGNHSTEQHNFQSSRRPTAGQKSDQPSVVRDSAVNAAQSKFLFPVYVNGSSTPYWALRDTGANFPSYIRSSLLSSEAQTTGKTMKVAGVTGNEQAAPIYMIRMQSPKFGFDHEIMVECAAVDELPYDMLIGNQFYAKLPEAKDIICVTDTEIERDGNDREVIETTDIAMPVTTRKQAAILTASRADYRSTEAERDSVTTDGVNDPAAPGELNRPVSATDDGYHHGAAIKGSGAKPTPTGISADRTDAASSSSSGADANDVLTDSRQPWVTDGDAGTDAAGVKTATSANHTLPETNERDPADKEFKRLRYISPEAISEQVRRGGQAETEFASEQKTDQTLGHWRHLAETRENSEFVIENGLLYRIAPGHVASSHNKLLVVPSKYRGELIQLAHNSWLGGHFGRNKVVDRLQALYAWPRMRQDISDHIRRCETCQKVAPLKTSERVPLQPVEHIQEPYADTSFDILGPALPLTTRRNKYILLHVDNATRHVQMVPMKNMRVASVADALMTIYCAYGVPVRTRFDQSTVNTGHLMTALRDRLGIQSCPAAIHTHRASCISERHIRTAETALRKFLPSCRRDWDVKLKYLTWAMNETKSDVTGFAPSELLFGRLSRGPLHILRDWWVAGQPELPAGRTDVVTYLETLRQTLQTASEIAHCNTEQQQDRMKENYDRQSTERALSEGQEVLLLMPDSPFKMEANWTGPVRVTRLIDKFNYEVRLPGGRKQVYHINMLRPFHRQGGQTDGLDGGEERDVVAIVINAADDDSDDEMPVVYEHQDSDEPKIFNIGDNLTVDQRSELLSLLGEFPEVFTEKTGRTHLIEHKITLLHNKPCRQPMYKIPHSIKDQVEEQLNTLLADGVIEESQTGGYSAPLVCVKKRNGQIRLCCNYSRLNEATAPDDYPMPDCAAILNRAAGKRWISTIDLRNFYFQIPLCAESQPLTAFDTEFGRFHFKMAPMGLRHSGKSAQRLVDTILRSASRYAAAMQDDIAIFSNDWKTHLSHIRDILTRIRNAGLTANTAKCQWVRERLQLLGHELFNGTVAPSDEKIRAIKDIQSISTKRQLHAWLGLCNYYRDHVKAFSQYSAVLTELLKKNVPEDLTDRWQGHHQSAFMELREALISKPIVRPPNPDRQYLLQTDACTRSISFILSQLDEDGNEYVVCYGSRKLKDRETRYSTIELECLALVTGAVKYEQYIYGKHVIVHCDHQPLSFLSQMSNSNSRLMRWSLILQRFDLEVVYRKAALHGNADAASRL